MWVFGDFGLLMPAIVPEKVQNDPEVLKWTNNGEYELQVRARLREHLQYFLDTHMPEGTYNPVIHETPNMDYNFRAYTTREAFAEGIKNIALAMDYEKFKVTSERFSWNKKYHEILNSIWATVCRLNEPGGFYGPWSPENPNGYHSASTYSEGWYTRRHNQVNRRIGDTFGVPTGDDKPNVFFGDEAEYEYEDSDDDSLEYVPESERRMYEIVDSLDEYGIPMREWWSYTSPREFALITPLLEEAFSKKVFRSMKRKNAKNAINWVSSYNGN